VNVLLFTTLVGCGALVAGFLGALTGLGGGVVLIPLLVFSGVHIRYAAGAALISVIATSSGAAASYVKEGYSNIRIGMFLEVATTIGALAGASLMPLVEPETIAILFGLVLLFSAYQSWRARTDPGQDSQPDRLATALRLDGTYPTPEGKKGYHVYKVPVGFALMFVAGALSGLLGIGSGALKVLAMDQVMRIPFKVSTTTSNFMIGVTAAASAGLYLRAGFIDPGLTMPVMLGVLAGSMLGARVLASAETKMLRRVFTLVILALALQMIYKGITEWGSR
jgi:uncharacterized membrane protein YfcA